MGLPMSVKLPSTLNLNSAVEQPFASKESPGPREQRGRGASSELLQPGNRRSREKVLSVIFIRRWAGSAVPPALFAHQHHQRTRVAGAQPSRQNSR